MGYLANGQNPQSSILWALYLKHTKLGISAMMCLLFHVVMQLTQSDRLARLCCVSVIFLLG